MMLWSNIIRRIRKNLLVFPTAHITVLELFAPRAILFEVVVSRADLSFTHYLTEEYGPYGKVWSADVSFKKR